MQFETERLLLRPWSEEDAESCYTYAKDPQVGLMCGWQPHLNVENSKEIIRLVLMAPETYAVCLKEDSKPIGNISLFKPTQSHILINEKEMEIGYWLGVPFWGKGIIPEAVRCLQQYVFEQLQCDALWCGCFPENTQSARVMEKCGFTFHHIEREIPLLLLATKKDVCFSRITKEEWVALATKL